MSGRAAGHLAAQLLLLFAPSILMGVNTEDKKMTKTSMKPPFPEAQAPKVNRPTSDAPASASEQFIVDNSPPEILDGSEKSARHLEAVAEIIRTRAGHHGDAIKQHAALARLWSAYLSNPMRKPGDPITAADVCFMLDLLKTSRVFAAGLQQEHVEDKIGYGAITLACMEADA